MTAKEELSQYKYKVKKVQDSLEEYEMYMARATKMTAILSESPAKTNLNSDKVGDNATKLADLDKEYHERWLAAEKERLEIVDKINQVDDPYRTLLIERYVHDKSFERIADEMKYSYDHVIHLHGDALALFEKVSIK